MNNSYITLMLFGVILFVFTVYFLIQKTNFPSGQPIKGLLQGIIQNIEQNEWSKAIEKAHRIEDEWEKHKYLIMLNYSEADYQLFEESIYQLAVGIQTKEKYETVSRARVGQKLWENFLKIIPEP